MAVGNPQARAITPRAGNNFDGLRLLAALAVVWNHVLVDPSGNSGLRLVMFFSISGFLVAGSWLSDPQWWRFLARRFLRIWPAYAFLVLVCAAASWLFPSPDMPELSRMASLFYLGNLFTPGFDWGFFPTHTPWMNQSLWMVPYELDLYLALAIVASFGRPLRVALAGVLLMFATRSSQTVAATGGLLECWSPYFAGFFAFGVLLRDVPKLRENAAVAACIAAGLALLMVGERSAGLLLIVPPGAVWIGEQSWPVLRSAARFGDLSLGVFLWACPIQQVTLLWLDARTPAPLQLLVILPQTLLVAWLSCRYIERPASRWKPKKPSATPRDATSAPSSPALPLGVVPTE